MPKNRKEFTLVGLGDTVQIGKQGGHFRWDNLLNKFAVRNAANTGFAPLLVPLIPTADGEASSKAYVDNLVKGIDSKISARVATSANITIATALVSGQTLDGVTLVDGDLVLVKNQTTSSQNGLYKVAATPVRVDDPLDTTNYIANAGLTSGAVFSVEEGGAYANTQWMLVTDGALVAGTTSLTFSRFPLAVPGTLNAVSTTFMFSDTTAKLIENVKGRVIDVVIDFNAAYDQSDATVVVGTTGNDDELAKGNQSDVTQTSVAFSVRNDQNYTTGTDLFVKSVDGVTAPTLGSGKVTVYYIAG